MPPTSSNCPDCKYAVLVTGSTDTFMCHRYPPISSPFIAGSTVPYSYPVRKAGDWCGEFVKS
jgi:hypothetical protein